MKHFLHTTGPRRFRKHLVLACAVFLAVAPLWAEEDDLANVLNQAKPAATAPAEPTDPSTQPSPDPLGTVKARPPAESRIGNLTLSNGTKYEGRIWTTQQTPLRVWIESLKMYRDIDLALVKRLDVVVEYERLEDDWRWLKEGSDVKVFSGKKYPNVSLAYQFTLLNDQTITGTIVAPIYVFDGKKVHPLALYKKYKGQLGETLDDLVYIKTITLDLSNATAAVNENKTTQLPLINDGY